MTPWRPLPLSWCAHVVTDDQFSFVIQTSRSHFSTRMSLRLCPRRHTFWTRLVEPIKISVLSWQHATRTSRLSDSKSSSLLERNEWARGTPVRYGEKYITDPNKYVWVDLRCDGGHVSIACKGARRPVCFSGRADTVLSSLVLASECAIIRK